MKHNLTLLLLTSLSLGALHTQAQTTTWGTNNSRTESRDNAGLQGNAGALSGFYETATPTNYPSGATSWWHLLDVRHSNPANNYSMQLAGSFYDQNLWFRKTNGNPAQPWSRVLTEISNNAIVGNGQSASSLNLSDIDGAGYLLNTGGYAFHIQKHMGGSNWETRLFIKQDGKIGIGTTDPVSKLHIEGEQFVSGDSRLGGTHDAVGYGSRLKIGDYGNSDPIWLSRYNIAYDQTELRINIGDGLDDKDKFVVGTTGHSDGIWSPGFFVDAAGKVGIGTMDTKGYRFAVNGDAIFTKVKVKTNSTWPDYVFSSDYPLPSLQEIEAYVKSNRHLPGLPSAGEVEKMDGIDIDEMNRKLLQKVEELTLYLILADKKTKELEDRIKKLEDDRK